MRSDDYKLRSRVHVDMCIAERFGHSLQHKSLHVDDLTTYLRKPFCALSREKVGNRNTFRALIRTSNGPHCTHIYLRMTCGWSNAAGIWRCDFRPLQNGSFEATARDKVLLVRRLQHGSLADSRRSGTGIHMMTRS